MLTKYFKKLEKDLTDLQHLPVFFFQNFGMPTKYKSNPPNPPGRLEEKIIRRLEKSG
jgi:hypothetical protein